MALPPHPLSIKATAARTTDQNGDKDHEDETGKGGQARPMSGSARKARYKRQGGKDMTPAQERRYAAKVAKNGYIPK